MEFFDKTFVKAYDDELFKMFGEKQEIYNFLRNHERRSVMLSNMRQQIFNVEMTSAYRLSRKDLEMLGRNFAVQFSKLAIEHAEQQNLSEAEKQRRLHADHEFNEIQEMLNEGDTYLEEQLADGTIRRTKI